MHRFIKPKGFYEGANAPSFITKMTFKDQVKALLDQGLHDRPDLFLVEFEVLDNHKIYIVLDGDNGVTLQDCIDISRAVEHNLDRESQDFSLEVSSAGATSPITNPRQYNKNIGRFIEIQTKEEKVEAELVEVQPDGIRLTWNSREPKKTGKGKETVTHDRVFPFSEIMKSQVIIKF